VTVSTAHHARPREPLPAALPGELRARLGDRVTTSAAVREQHGKDESAHPVAPPDAVAFPASTAEVAEIARLWARDGVPMIAFGVGTSVEGHVLAIHGGLCFDLSRMNRVLDVHADHLDTRAGARPA
jgi:D-lactate dehydrogenase (cytochrome)